MAQWNIDPTHSFAEFTVRHMMVTNVRGTFSGMAGTLNFDPEAPENSSIDVSVQIATVSTREEQRDAHLRSGDFFDAEKYPTMHFKSTKAEKTGDGIGKVTGELIIRDTTKEVTFDVEYFGLTENSPFGDTRTGFTGSTTINREEFGLTWNQALETGGVLVGKDVKISVELQAVLAAEAEAV